MTSILFRGSLAEEGELDVCRQYFKTTQQRSCVEPGVVIGRYSVLPYYHELELDLEMRGSYLINSYSQHRWIADFEYYEDVKPYTPETWGEHDFCNCQYTGPFVVKGCTNSKKFNWSEQMYAQTKRDALHVACRLHDDMHLGSQDVIFRKYVPLKVYETGMHGLPFANEWRVFCYKDQILSRGYYWSSASNETVVRATWGGERLVKTLVPIVSQHVNFYVLDVAETESGEWILIEINDGQMSGLSENDPHILYSNLARAVCHN
jgi:hypothetical protein